MQNLSPLLVADFLKLDSDPVGVAGGVAKIKVAYNLVLTWILLVCINQSIKTKFMAPYAASESEAPATSLWA